MKPEKERIEVENKSINHRVFFGSSSHVATSHREASRVVLGKRPFGCPSATPTLSPPLRLSHPQRHRNIPDADVAERDGQRREEPALEQREAGRVRCENDGARGGGELAASLVDDHPRPTASNSQRVLRQLDGDGDKEAVDEEADPRYHCEVDGGECGSGERGERGGDGRAATQRRGARDGRAVWLRAAR